MNFTKEVRAMQSQWKALHGLSLLGALVAAASCATTQPAIAPPTGPLAPGFGKIWTGAATTSCASGPSTTGSPDSMSCAVSGNSLTAEVACPDKTMVLVTATGSGNVATWSGKVDCPRFASKSGTCATAEFTLTSMKFTLNSDGTLSVRSTGTWSGCGTSFPCTVSSTRK
jgi:hypothetical protein